VRPEIASAIAASIQAAAALLTFGVTLNLARSTREYVEATREQNRTARAEREERSAKALSATSELAVGLLDIVKKYPSMPDGNALGLLPMWTSDQETELRDLAKEGGLRSIRRPYWRVSNWRRSVNRCEGSSMSLSPTPTMG